MISIFLQIIIGFIIADILTGAFHWFEDSYLDYCIDIPILSDIAKDNEMHHYFPRSMLAYSYFEHITYSLPLTLIIIGLFIIIDRSILKYPFFLFSFGIFSIFSNVFHRFSHMRECENHLIVNLLQKTGILCSHKHHSLHHTKVSGKYCVISEYNNYILDTLNFWGFLEYIIFLVFQIQPKQKQSYDDYYLIQNKMHFNSRLECPDTPTIDDINELKENLYKYMNCPK